MSNSFLKLVAAISLASLVSTAMIFSFYKAFNQYIDSFAYEVLDFLALWGIDIGIEQLWIALGVLFLVVILVMASRSD